MFEYGFAAALGVLVLLARLPWRYKLMLTSNPLMADVGVFVLLTALHWGTFSGVMIASIAALFCSVTLSLARRLIGFHRDGVYIRGFFDVSHRVKD